MPAAALLTYGCYLTDQQMIEGAFGQGINSSLSSRSGSLLINYSTHGDTDVALKLLLLQWPPGELLTIPAFDVIAPCGVLVSIKCGFKMDLPYLLSIDVENATADLL